LLFVLEFVGCSVLAGKEAIVFIGGVDEAQGSLIVGHQRIDVAIVRTVVVKVTAQDAFDDALDDGLTA
jgi:hypothetical protein